MSRTNPFQRREEKATLSVKVSKDLKERVDRIQRLVKGKGDGLYFAWAEEAAKAIERTVRAAEKALEIGRGPQAKREAPVAVPRPTTTARKPDETQEAPPPKTSGTSEREGKKPGKSFFGTR